MPDRRGSGDKVTWKSYVDAIFEEHREQVRAALAAHDMRVEANHESAHDRLEALRREFEALLQIGAGVQLRDYVEAMFVEGRRATELGERERAGAAMALRSEQQRAQDVAEREREKSAQALAVTLGQSIRDGDERLREHIGNQIEQINQALSAVESRALIRHDGHRVQMDDRFGYTEAAVAKAEQATEKRFVAVNAFREQLADQATNYVLREVVDAQFAELRKSVSQNTTRLDLIQGTTQGSSASVAQMVGIVGLVIALVAIGVGAFT